MKSILYIGILISMGVASIGFSVDHNGKVGSTDKTTGTHSNTPPVGELKDLAAYTQCASEVNRLTGGLQIKLKPDQYMNDAGIPAVMGERGGQKGLFWYGGDEKVYFIPLGDRRTHVEKEVPYKASRFHQPETIDGYWVAATIPGKGQINFSCATSDSEKYGVRALFKDPDSKEMLCFSERGPIEDAYGNPIETTKVQAVEIGDRSGLEPLSNKMEDLSVKFLREEGDKELSKQRADRLGTASLIENYLIFNIDPEQFSGSRTEKSRALRSQFNLLNEAKTSGLSLKDFARKQYNTNPRTMSQWEYQPGFHDHDGWIAASLIPRTVPVTSELVEEIVGMMRDTAHGKEKYVKLFEDKFAPSIQSRLNEALASQRALVQPRYEDAKKNLAACENVGGPNVKALAEQTSKMLESYMSEKYPLK